MKYIVEMSQSGFGRLHAKIEVEAESKEEAIEEAYEQPIEWKVSKFSGEGYVIDNVTEVTSYQSIRPPSTPYQSAATIDPLP